MDSTLAAFIGAIIGGLIGGAGSYYGGKKGARDNFELANRNERLRAAKKISAQIYQWKERQKTLPNETETNIILVILSDSILIENWMDEVSLLDLDDESTSSIIFVFSLIQNIGIFCKKWYRHPSFINLNDEKKTMAEDVLFELADSNRKFFINTKESVNKIDNILKVLIQELEQK